MDDPTEPMAPVVGTKDQVRYGIGERKETKDDVIVASRLSSPVEGGYSAEQGRHF